MSMKTTLATVLLIVSTMTGVVQAKSPEELNDLEIAHVAYTAGSIDIRYAHLALALSSDPKVRQFAETMIRDHTAVNEQALALVKELGVTPKDNDVSRDLVKQSNALIAELRTLDGAAFDERYANNELKYHRFVNKAVEKIFIPNAKNAELRALLASALKVFKVHEGHAENMVKIVN